MNQELKAIGILKAKKQVLESDLKDRIDNSHNIQYEDDNEITSAKLKELKSIDEAIEELEKLVDERNKFANMGMAAPVIPPVPDEQPLGSRILLLNENEKVFWQEAYIHAMKINSRLVSKKIFPLLTSHSLADEAIEDLRLRLGSDLKKELIQ